MNYANRIYKMLFLSGLVLLIVPSLISIAIAQSCVEPPLGLVSWWSGNGSAQDVWGRNHGGLRNGVTFAAGNVGRAFSFDGIDDFVRVKHSASLNLEEHTIEAWINPDVQLETYSYHGIVVKQNSDNSGRNYYVGLRNNGKIHYSISNPSPFIFLESASTVQSDSWTHIATTYDGETLKIYINGHLDASLSVGAIVPGKTTQPLLIGHTNEAVQTFFKGLIDEVGIYRRALSASEIEAIFTAGRAGKCNPVGGTLTGVRPKGVIVLCENLTTGQEVTIQNGTRSWNCEAAGLLIKAGDQLQQTIIDQAD